MTFPRMHNVSRSFQWSWLVDELFDCVDLPPGMHSIFISSATQQAMQLCVDEDLTQENNVKMIDKELILNDIQAHGQVSSFFEFQQQIQVRDYEKKNSDSIRRNLFRSCFFSRAIPKMKSLLSMIMTIFIRKIFVSDDD